MCGIFGILALKYGFDFGIFALKQLQNRGYDSAGALSILNNEFVLNKFASTTDKDSILELEKTKEEYKNTFNGIFHTRWATHGAKTDYNAHPHLDYKEQIGLVHNGIIENYYELKLELEKDYGIIFKSETDTEVIVNLISIYYDETNDMEKAIMKTTSRLQGTWALVILNKNIPDHLYCARHGSPLLIGLNDSYIMVSSEQAGFGSNVNNYVCLKNDDITTIKKENNRIVFENLDNYELRKITTKQNELTPEPYDHWTLKEINEQYDSSIRAISFGGRIIEDDMVRLGGPEQHIEELREIKYLLLLGCGTSLNAGNHSISFFKKLCNFDVVMAFDGSEFTEDDIPKNSNGKVCAIFLSQSGETKDLYRCFKICRDSNIFTIGVINVVDSLIAREVDCGCYLNAGREVGVASTKAFTSQVIILSMLAIFFAQIHGINKHLRKLYISSLRQLPSDIRKTIKNTHEITKEISKELIDHKSMFVLGKGNMISVANEGSLKTKEIGYIHAEAYGGNALRHGPYAIIEKNTPIIFVMPNDNNFSLMNNTVEEVKSRNAMPIIISDSNNSLSRHSHCNIIVESNSVYNGILHNIPLQLIAYHMALQKGHNPDMPKNLSKCVSV
jgi:glucosamine--fructose-6-phosphate aminotransferase (isomerizing)